MKTYEETNIDAQIMKIADIDDIFNELLIFVNDGHPVFSGELLRQFKPHLTGTHDNDIHRPFS